MPSFEYEATRANGERVSSVAFGRDMQDVMQSLAGQGLQVLRIEDAYAKSDPLRTGSQIILPPARTAAPTAPRIEQTPPQTAAADPTPPPPDPAPRALPPTGKRNPIITMLFGPLLRVKLQELSFFFRQFGTMIEAGVPMVTSLDTLSKQSRDPRIRGIVSEMARAADAGMQISTVMQRYPEVFTPLMVSLIRAGEEGGFLGQACKQISEYMDHEIELRNMYKKETFLPKLYVFASIIIIGGTNLLIASLGLKGGLYAPLNDPDVWKVLGPGLIALFLFFRVGLANYRIRTAWDQILLYVPYIGKTLHHFAMAKFGRAFSALYKGGVPITRSIHLAADATGNEYIRGRIYPAVSKLEDGEGISQTLAETRVFSPIVLNMVATGETTGSLDQMLTKMSEFYEDEAKVRAHQLAKVVGVVLMVAIGVYVAFVVISFYVGYFTTLLQGV